ncbi:uncharacterized protein LOC117573652 isoform X1 [Drosophila albomicans]|uniref:Uncharacterized protein LOC117573652 isoform X1 n=1 Tax=Drosophila albomicans TaxID=7291 RepID=A0A9C6SYL0_DROAB|nr:uncharacterized protein LOC117573652 isoform X1 [Drosophila albomicans]
MRLDGALEPRHGAATLQGRFIGVAKYRRETRVKCEQQQQQCADEDDEAAAAAAAAVSTAAEAAAASSAAAATIAAKDANNNSSNNNNNNNQNNNYDSNNYNNNNKSSESNNCRWEASEQQAQHLSPSQAPSIIIATQTNNKANLHLRIKGVATTATATTTTAASLKMREEQSLMLMDRRTEVDGVGVGSSNNNNMGRLQTYVLCLISVFALLPRLPVVLADDGDNFFAVNSFSVGPETTTPEFDYASRGQKKFGDKCENTLECGFPGSICDPKKKSCQCTEDLHVTNHIDKCGKASAVNESCFFNEQCEAVYFQTECRDGRCICRFEMSPIWGKDGSVECKGRQDKRGPETYIDPAMIGVLVGMALMFIIICVVLRLFSQARWRENRTIFNTPNPRLMNVSLLRDSKLLHGQERRGSRMSVRAPSRQPSMASLRPHSPNPSLGKTGSQSESRGSASNASAASVRSNRSNSVAPGKVSSGGGHHERHGSSHRQHHSHAQQQLQSPQEEALITNITTNPVAESVTVEIIEPGHK